MRHVRLLPWSIGSVAFGGASLVVPLYVVTLGGGAFELGVLASVAALAGVPGALVVGRLVDRRGTKRSDVVVTLVATAVVLAALAGVRNLVLVVVANGVVWLAFAAAMPVMTLLAVRDAPQRDWAERIGTLNKYQGIGWAAGLGLGLVWGGVGDRFVSPQLTLQAFLVALGIVAGLGAVSTRWLVPGDGTRVGDPNRFRSAIRRADRFTVRAVTFPITIDRADFRGLDPRQFIRRFTPTLAAYFAAAFLFFTGFATFFAPLPAFLAEAGQSTDGIFALYLLSSLASAATFGVAGRVASARGPLDLQVGGLLFRGLSFPAVAATVALLGVTVVGIVVLAAIFAVIGITWAVISVTGGTLVTSLTPAAIRGESLGTYAALGAAAGGVGSLLGGTLGAQSYGLAFTVAGGLIVAGAAIVVTLRPLASSTG
ncbi:MAG: MFS transporter [Halobacteriales archaeon]